VESLQQLAADTPSPYVGVNKDHGHVAIVGDDRSSAVLRATGFSQCHRQHDPVRIEVADDKTGLRLGQLLPDPGHPVSVGGLESGDVSGVPDADGSLVICREPIEDGQVHILIVPAQFGVLVPRQDRPVERLIGSDGWPEARDPAGRVNCGHAQ